MIDGSPPIMTQIRLLLILSISCKISIQRVVVTDDDRLYVNGFSLPTFVKSAGYPIEVHKNIETEDGYLLDIHRIPQGRHGMNKGKEKRENRKPVVFFMHGLAASAEVWLINGPNRSLPFLLADKGYDVWLGNSRGTSHSKKHVNLTSYDAQFWNYSWHEIGFYDLPAMLNYILNTSAQPQLTYFGHSQGGTSFLVMCSTRPAMNAKIRLMVGFAPAVYGLFDAMSLSPENAAPIFVTLDYFRKAFSMYEFGPMLRALACNDILHLREICQLSLISVGLLSGLNLKQTEKALMPRIMQTYPDAASVRQYFHYIQVFLTGFFRQYDFGYDENMRRYGRIMPPFYNLTKVTAPMAIFYGQSDFLVSPMSAEKMIKQLPNVVVDHMLAYPEFNHMDFVWAKDIVELLYKHVWPVLEQYTTV